MWKYHSIVKCTSNKINSCFEVLWHQKLNNDCISKTTWLFCLACPTVFHNYYNIICICIEPYTVFGQIMFACVGCGFFFFLFAFLFQALFSVTLFWSVGLTSFNWFLYFFVIIVIVVVAVFYLFFFFFCVHKLNSSAVWQVLFVTLPFVNALPGLAFFFWHLSFWWLNKKFIVCDTK